MMASFFIGSSGLKIIKLVIQIKNGTGPIEYKDINEILKDISSNALDYFVLDEDGNYTLLPKHIKEKLEDCCEGDELNSRGLALAKTEIYNCFKRGDIKKPKT